MSERSNTACRSPRRGERLTGDADGTRTRVHAQTPEVHQ
jgi:hypothetical protein